MQRWELSPISVSVCPFPCLSLCQFICPCPCPCPGNFCAHFRVPVCVPYPVYVHVHMHVDLDVDIDIDDNFLHRIALISSYSDIEPNLIVDILSNPISHCSNFLRYRIKMPDVGCLMSLTLFSMWVPSYVLYRST